MIVSEHNRQIVTRQIKAVASDEADRPQSAERAIGGLSRKASKEDALVRTISSDADREGDSPTGGKECQR